MAFKDFTIGGHGWQDKKNPDGSINRGLLSTLGRTLNNVSAPFGAAYGNNSGYEAMKLQQQQDQADMEFQRYLSDKAYKMQELGIKEKSAKVTGVMNGIKQAYQMGITPDQLNQLVQYQSGGGSIAMNPQQLQQPQQPPPEAMMSLAKGGYGDVNGDSIAQQLHQQYQSQKPSIPSNISGILNTIKDNSPATLKAQAADQRNWSNFIKTNTPDTASSRSTFGIASRSNLQAGRVIKTLKDNPNVTYQDLGNVVADLAGIYAGGAPTDQGMKHQQYETLYTQIKNLKQYATGKPQNSVPEGVKNKILGVAQQTIDLNKIVLEKHFNAQEKAQAKLIKKFPEEWKNFREQAQQDYIDGSPTSAVNNQQLQSLKSKYGLQ